MFQLFFLYKIPNGAIRLYSVHYIEVNVFTSDINHLKAALILTRSSPFHEAQKMIRQNCIIFNTDIFLHWCNGVITAMTSALAVNHHKIVLLFVDGLIHVNEINHQVFKWAIWYWDMPISCSQLFSVVMFSTNHTMAQQIVNRRYQIDCGPYVLLANYFPRCGMGLPACITKQQRKEWGRSTVHHAIKQGLMTSFWAPVLSHSWCFSGEADYWTLTCAWQEVHGCKSKEHLQWQHFHMWQN